MTEGVTDVETFPIYSNRALQLLEVFNTYDLSKPNNLARSKNPPSIGVSGCANFSDGEENEFENNNDDSSSLDSSGNELDEMNSIIKSDNVPKSHERSNKNKSKKKTKEQLMKQIVPPPTMTITINVQQSSNAAALQLPSALFPLEEQEEYNPYKVENSAKPTYLKLYEFSRDLNTSLANKNCRSFILILTLQSGRFAAAIFHKGDCIKHTTSTRYTTRKGQGGAQSSNDNAKGKANSMGSQLRRAGELQLRKDVLSALRDWSLSGDLGQCALYFLSVSKNLQKGFWDDVATLAEGKDFFYKKSSFVRNIPLDFGRPSFESCNAVYDLMTACVLQRIDLDRLNKEETCRDIPKLEFIRGRGHEEAVDENMQMKGLSKKVEATITPLSSLHKAARDGNFEVLTSLLSLENKEDDDVDLRAGIDSMTPLHYAANMSDNQVVASKCVYALLVEGRANPCIHDARNRPPYFLSSGDNVRNAFRKARSHLGENVWNWTESAKVPSPLSKTDLGRKKEKAAEKKRRQRQRQKQRKAKLLADNAEAERLTKEAEYRNKLVDDEKRVRSGLMPKTGALACDLCGKTSRRKSQMVFRLEYCYCSSECVKSHQRKLMASAAFARFNNN